MYVEGRVLTTEGEPIADAVIETWEADHNGMASIQWTHPRLRPCTHRHQGSTTLNMPTEPIPTVGDDCILQRMVALGIVPLFPALTPFRVT